jgi:hypothetical protein
VLHNPEGASLLHLAIGVEDLAKGQYVWSCLQIPLELLFIVSDI